MQHESVLWYGRWGGGLKMVVQLGFLRDALIEAGAIEARAGKAARELAGYENEFAAIRGDTAALRADTKAEFASVRGELNLLKWTLASLFALVLAVALKIFLH